MFDSYGYLMFRKDNGEIFVVVFGLVYGRVWLFFASTIGDEALKKKVGELVRVCDEAYYGRAEPVHFREQIITLLPGG